MEITLPISSLLILFIGSFGICVSILVGLIFLFQSKAKTTSTYILSALLILSGLTLLNEVLTTSGITNRIKFLYFIPIYYALSIGPLFYLFVKSKYQQKLSRFDWIHLVIPCIQATTYLLIGFTSVSFKSNLWNDTFFRNYSLIEGVLFPVSIVIYSGLTIYLLRKPQQKTFFWSGDLKRWLSHLTRVFIAIAMIELILFIGENVFGSTYPPMLFLARIVIFVALVLWMSYNTIKLLFPSSIFSTSPQKRTPQIDHEAADQLKGELERLMSEDQIYLNPDLSLSLLAQYLHTSEKRCSQLFSQELATNFNQFVNARRIESFKEKVRNGAYHNFTLMSLAYDSGFESKSTFNRTFKQIEGKSPSSYIKSLPNTWK